jgi:CRP-like cAMP-binding protein
MSRHRCISAEVTALIPNRIPRIYPRGSKLFCEGDAPRGVFYVQEGVVELFSTIDKAQMGHKEEFTTGSIVGLNEIFSEERHPKTAICRTLTARLAT